MSLKLACPRCRHVQFFDDAFAGQPVTCAKCEQAFRVPRQEEPEPDAPPPPASMALPWTASMQARELPTTFAPPDIPAVKVVEVPVDSRSRRTYDPQESWTDGPSLDRSGSSLATAEPVRTGPRISNLRTRTQRQEPVAWPWRAGASTVAFVLVAFAVTAAWFLLRNDRQPQPQPWAGQVPQNPQQQFPPQQFQPQQPPRPQFRPGPGFVQGRMRQRPMKGNVAPTAPQPGEEFIRVKLEKGLLKIGGALNGNDAMDPLAAGCHRKVFLIELEARRTYTIELNNDPPRPPDLDLGKLDPFVRLEDPKGLILDENDDAIGPVHVLDSRITVTVPAKAVYRIVATSFEPNQAGNFILIVRDESGGKPVAAKVLPERKLPQPSAVKRQLPLQKLDERNLTITTLWRDKASLVGDLCWSDDGQAFFMLDDQGAVRRIAWPAAIEECRLETGLKAANVSLARSGLLVCFPGIEEVWVVDPQSLHVKRRISVPQVQRVAASPALAIAFAAAKVTYTAPIVVNPLFPRPKAPPQPFPVKENLQTKDVIVVLDGDRAEPISYYDFPPKNLKVSADGKFLFTEGGIERLVRYTIKDKEVAFDQESPRLASDGQGIFVSPDTKYVCMPAPRGNYGAEPSANLKEHTTLIFKVGDLKQPAFTIHTGPSVRVIGFDPKAGAVFAHNNDKQFMVFSETGVKRLEVNLPGDDPAAVEPRQFLTHPDGHHVLVRTDRAIHSIALPRDEEK